MTHASPLVRDLMIPLARFPHLRDDQPVHEAVALLLATNDGSAASTHDELLVINSDSQYVGRFGLKQALRCYFPTLATQSSQIFAGKQEKFTDLAFLLEDSFQGQCRTQGGLPLRQFMVPPLKSIKAELHPLHAAELMLVSGENYLPVAENKALVGVVRLADIFRHFATSCSL